MTTHIERQGSSLLDAALESQGKSKDGHILMTPRDSGEILLGILYAYYVEQVSKTPLPGGRSDIRIEALRRVFSRDAVRISGRTWDDEVFDFTDTLDAVKRERAAEAERRVDEIRRHLGTYTPPSPTRAI